MIRGAPVRVEDVHNDRCSRSGRAWIGAKPVLLHTLAPLITRTPYDRRAYLESRVNYPSDTDHAGMMVVRSIDLGAALGPLRASLGQTALGGMPSARVKRDLIGATPLMVDPSTDYTWYARHQKELADDPDTPLEIRRLARDMQEKLPKEQRRLSGEPTGMRRIDVHDKFWLGLLHDGSAAPSIVSQALAAQHRWGADVALPPVPAARDARMLEVSDKINRLARAVWTGDSCADYIILTQDFLSDESNVDALTGRLLSSRARISVLKIKNHTLEQVPKVGERVMLKRILEAVNEAKSSDPNRLFALLEAGHAMYPAAAGGFDIVSTSMTGIDYESPGYAPSGLGWGHYYSPKHMTTLKWASVRKMLSKNGLPCSCTICREMPPNPPKDVWNLQRRSHYVHCASGGMLADLTRFVDDQRIELARQRITKSAISNFAGVLPYVH